MKSPRSAINSEDNNRYSSPPCTNQMISRKRKTKTEFQFLPEEIIFKILLLLPAKVLNDVMRTVCQSCRKVTRDPIFIKAYRSSSTASPFCLFTYRKFFKIYSLRDDKITWKFNKTINQIYLTHGDGFILTLDRDDPCIFYLVNPLTQQIISLPQQQKGARSISVNYTVSCSPLTLKYKVVIARWPKLYIVTVGDDKEWREIVVEPGLSREIVSRLQLSSVRGRSISHQGFIYWYTTFPCTYLIALDVEKEVFHKVVLPREVRPFSPAMCSGSSLVVIYTTSVEGWKFWELVDCRNGGEWTKFGTVDFGSKKQEIIKIVGVYKSRMFFRVNFPPIAILSRDIVIFGNVDCYLLAYNFKTEKFSRCFDYPRNRARDLKLVTDNSLVIV